VKGRFDGEGFYEALNSQRIGRRLTWKDVAEESGISASTLTRMAQGKRPDVDGLAALLRWSNLKLEDFIENPKKERTETLAQMTAILRSDPRLSASSKKTLEGVLRATYEGLRKPDRS
jgi:transcriptional regulator with XRE-family HTH domain